MIFTIPVWLAYSSEAGQLPFGKEMIHDTPVFDRNHAAHKDGRAAIRSVIQARMMQELFSEGQMTKLIVASGGNIRELFQLTLDAADNAVLRDAGANSITESDSDKALNKMRKDYRRTLGQSPYDIEPIPYNLKRDKLVAIYSGDDRDIGIPDPVLYSLLRARAIQEFNGEGWFGVHPLVVDILKEQGHLSADSAGGTS
jgi:hypothetical protein